MSQIDSPSRVPKLYIPQPAKPAPTMVVKIIMPGNDPRAFPARLRTREFLELRAQLGISRVLEDDEFEEERPDRDPTLYRTLRLAGRRSSLHLFPPGLGHLFEQAVSV